jgi:alkanesulfonate monooxygenase SsuD/methylene tetrahydromethanopterin reductase-like flavin-dependent oxidoreductase (luciferase family)
LNKIRYGFCLPLFSGASAWDYDLDFKQMKKAIVAAESLGLDSVWVPDLLSMGYGDRIFEAWTILSAASQITDEIRLGTLVSCVTHRSPSLLAKMSATLDVISDGRFELGLGAGWRSSEQIAYGFQWEPSVARRLQRLAEAVEIIKGMWTNPRFTYLGEYFKVKDVSCEPKPIQKPRPRILLGGSENLVLRTIAKYADAWNVAEVSPDEFARKFDILHSYCKLEHRDFNSIGKSVENLLLVTDRETDLQRVVEWSKTFAGIEAEPEDHKPRMETITDVKRRYIVGSVKEVTERIADYIDAGSQEFMFYFLDYPSLKTMKALAKDVIPSLS